MFDPNSLPPPAELFDIKLYWTHGVQIGLKSMNGMNMNVKVATTHLDRENKITQHTWVAFGGVEMYCRLEAVATAHASLSEASLTKAFLQSPHSSNEGSAEKLRAHRAELYLPSKTLHSVCAVIKVALMRSVKGEHISQAHKIQSQLRNVHATT